MALVYMLMGDGFEEIEAISVVDILRRGGVDIKTASITGDLRVMGAHNIAIEADMLFDMEEILKADMLILPGGGPGTQALKDHSGSVEACKKFAAEGKLLGAICAAPSVFGVNNLLDGQSAVCYPGFENQLIGATIGKNRVELSGKFITSIGPGSAMEFALEILKLLCDKGTYSTVKDGLLTNF